MTKKAISIIAIITLIVMMGILFAACNNDKKGEIEQEKTIVKDANYYANIFRNAGLTVQVWDEESSNTQVWNAKELVYAEKDQEGIQVIIYETADAARVFWDESIEEGTTTYEVGTSRYIIDGNTIIIGHSKYFELLD